jgi:Cu/Ag efflux pump CusA
MSTTVIGGMLAATFIAIFVIPVLFAMVERLAQGKTRGTVIAPTTPLPAPH